MLCEKYLARRSWRGRLIHIGIVIYLWQVGLEKLGIVLSKLFSSWQKETVTSGFLKGRFRHWSTQRRKEVPFSCYCSSISGRPLQSRIWEAMQCSKCQGCTMWGGEGHLSEAKKTYQANTSNNKYRPDKNTHGTVSMHSQTDHSYLSALGPWHFKNPIFRNCPAV